MQEKWGLPFRPLYYNQLATTGKLNVHNYYLLFILLSFQCSWTQSEQGALWKICLWITVWWWYMFGPTISGLQTMCCDYAVEH